MNSKARDTMHLRHFFESLMDDDIGVFLGLTTLVSNIKSELFWVLDSFLSFLKTYEEKKTHIMLSLMLDPRFNNLHFVSSYVGKEQRVSVVEEYDRRAWYPMLVKSYNHLHPIGDVVSNSKKQDDDQDYGLNIFQITNKGNYNKEVVRFFKVSCGCERY
jgi:hypothetical protein